MKQPLQKIYSLLRGKLLVIFALASIFQLQNNIASGATLIVTNTNDSGSGSLRDQIGAASADDTIRFDNALDGIPISLSSQIDVTFTLYIFGNGSSNTILDGGGSSRILHVSSTGYVRIYNIKITNGYSILDNGGGLLNEGHLSFYTCLFENNVADGFGGLIYNTGYLFLDHCSVQNNLASGNSGGAIFSGIGSELYVYFSTLSGNHAAGFGGAISGGGAFDLNTSTFSGNSCGAGGGAIHSEGALNLINSTVAYNESSADAGGLDNYSGSLTMINTILSNNAASGGSGQDAVNAGIIDGSSEYNIVSNNTGFGLTGLGNQLDVDPLLDLLADNGGLTQTHALLCGSPAIDAGIPNANSYFDQRDEVRSLFPDIGAYEFFAPDYSVTVSGYTITAVLTGALYQWIDCNTNTPIAGEIGASFTAATNGSYAVIISSNGCSDTSICTPITTIGISPVEQFDGVQLYPNPVHSELNIVSSSETEIESAAIRTLTGQTIALALISDKHSLHFNASSLQTGFYIAEIHSAKSVIRIKFVKK